MSRRQWIYLAVPAALLLGCVAWVQLTFRQLNRVSPEFRTASTHAYQSIGECDEKLKEETASFRTCMDNAEKALSRLRMVARTHRERVQFALLGSYVRSVRGCRKDWEQSDVSADAKDRLDRLASSRQDLKQRLGED
jgi:hypothetical protein